MALIIDLKPYEKVIIGSAIISNDEARTRLHIAGEAAIMREKDVMREKDADTPCKRIYLLIQLMYLSPTPMDLHDSYFSQISAVQTAAPSTSLYLMKVNDFILNNQYYKALKETRHLIEHERKILAQAV